MSKLKTVNIQGKPYITVNERLKEFRENAKYEGLSLVSEWIKVDESVAICRAVIYKDLQVLATGTAMERAGDSFINKTSHVENAETSAWGRALGNLGIGIDASVATADEVANAVLNKDKPVREKIVTGRTDPPKENCTTEQMKQIESLCKETNTNQAELYKYFSAGLVPTKLEAQKMIVSLKAKLSKQLDATATK